MDEKKNTTGGEAAVADNDAIYQGWKAALAKNGKTPMDMVEHYKSIGMGDYASSLLSFIQKMEGSAAEPGQ